MPEDITIRDAQRHRDTLYQTIADAVERFEAETGLLVSSIDYGPSLVPDPDEEYEYEYELDIVVELA